MKIKLFSRDGGFVTEVVIPPFHDPPEVLMWSARIFVLPNPDNYGHRHVKDLPSEEGVTFYVEAWAYIVPMPEVKR